jgi:hypothetical protein
LVQKATKEPKALREILAQLEIKEIKETLVTRARRAVMEIKALRGLKVKLVPRAN